LGRAISLPSLLWKVYFEQKEQNCCRAYKRSGYEILKYDFFRISAFCNVT
jgi:hypothetical protein